MHDFRSWLQRYPVISYFGLSFLLAWAIWIPVGIFAPIVTTAMILPGAWMPTVSALLLTAYITNGASLIRDTIPLLNEKDGYFVYLSPHHGSCASRSASRAMQQMHFRLLRDLLDRQSGERTPK